MNVVMSWLREFCPADMGVDELADVLSRQGVHVEEILRPWQRLAGVVVARVIEVKDHPGSDTLCLARVEYGSGERELVVGVRNMAPGDLVPLAGPGATVAGLDEPLEARTIRGVVSQGMLCSPRELGVSGDHEGILILPTDTPVGADFGSHFGLTDEAVLDIEVEPNRPDLMSVVGVAREVAAATGVPLTVPDPEVAEDAEKAGDAATVEIMDLERCSQYLARIFRDVTVRPSPLAVQARLSAAAMRPISNVVDATNYAMLELGQPMHPFDLAQLEGPGIVVRLAEDGERLVTLDDVERELLPEDLVIADLGRAVAIAGVMGSAAAEVGPGTRDVLLESAHFTRTGILRTARRLGLITEASMRFERGADPEIVPRAADRAAQLIAAWSGGRILAGAIDVGGPPPRRRVGVRPRRTSLLLGYDVAARDIRESLARIRIEAEGDDVVEAEIPGFRPDLEGEVDLIEEVARILGYGQLHSTVPGIKQAGDLAPTYRFRRRLKEALVRSGLREILSLSFAFEEDLELMDHAAGMRMANPVTSEAPFLRPSLVPGLLRALRLNASRQVESAALFEVGHVFHPGDPVAERESVAVAMAGPADSGHPGELRFVDFFDAKGVVEALMISLGIAEWSVGEPMGRPYHPTRSALVRIGEETAGAVGELAPRVASRMDLPRRVAVLELDVETLARHAIAQPAYQEIPRFPPVRRDLAFVVAAEAPAGEVLSALVGAGEGLVDDASLFDVFAGPPLPEGKKNLAFAVVFRAPDRTLTDPEVDTAVGAIVERLANDFGAEFRSV